MQHNSIPGDLPPVISLDEDLFSRHRRFDSEFAICMYGDMSGQDLEVFLSKMRAEIYFLEHRFADCRPDANGAAKHSREFWTDPEALYMYLCDFRAAIVAKAREAIGKSS